jgi:hypothetical protein
VSLHATLLQEALLVAAVWTGHGSREWDRLLMIARESGIKGLEAELLAYKKMRDDQRRIRGY